MDIPSRGPFKGFSEEKNVPQKTGRNKFLNVLGVLSPVLFLTVGVGLWILAWGFEFHYYDKIKLIPVHAEFYSEEVVQAVLGLEHANTDKNIGLISFVLAGLAFWLVSLDKKER